MKIAMIGHKRIPSREGGVERVVEELAVRMAKKGHEAGLAACQMGRLCNTVFKVRGKDGGKICGCAYCFVAGDKTVF